MDYVGHDMPGRSGPDSMPIDDSVAADDLPLFDEYYDDAVGDVLADDDMEVEDEGDAEYGGDDANTDYDSDYDDDDINMAAYDTINLDGNGVQKTEQAGVFHLVHGWTQRGHPHDVSLIVGRCSFHL